MKSVGIVWFILGLAWMTQGNPMGTTFFVLGLIFMLNDNDKE